MWFSFGDLYQYSFMAKGHDIYLPLLFPRNFPGPGFNMSPFQKVKALLSPKSTFASSSFFLSTTNSLSSQARERGQE
jgi:hypothetical protein